MSNTPDLTVVQGSKADPAAAGGGKKATQKIGNFEVPYGYEVWGDGIYHIEVPPDDNADPDIQATPSSYRRQGLRIVAHEPIWIRRFGRALDTGEQLVELAFRDALSHEIQAQWVNRLDLAAKIHLVKLAKRGLPVNDGNVQALMFYLDHALHLNGPKLEVVQVAARSGAYQLEYLAKNEKNLTEKRTGWGWLLGDRWVGPVNTRVEADPRQLHQNARGFMVSGSEEEWFEKFKEVVAKGPIARFLTYSTFAAPLLRFIKQRTFIIHHWGAAGGGKTALAKFAATAWGDQSMLMQNFNRTQLAFIEMFKHIDDLPVTFDELQSSGMKDHAPLIYALCLEHGRGRAGRDGGLQEEVQSWRSVVRTTGEEPIIGKGGLVDLGGQANRVVQIGTPVLSTQEASELHQWIERKHFGWGGLRFLERLGRALEFADGEAVIEEKFRELHAALTSRVSIALHARTLQLATVALAQYLANRWFLDADADSAFQGAIDDAVAVADTIAAEEVQETLADQALQLFRDHFAAHRNSWYDLSDRTQEEQIAQGSYKSLTGILVPNEVWIVQREANLILSKANLPQRRVWADLKRAGVLYTYDRGLDGGEAAQKQNGVARRYGKFHSKCYVLHRDRCGPFTSDDRDDVVQASPAPIAAPAVSTPVGGHDVTAPLADIPPTSEA